jgi:preprotein translocase subunit YajC
MEFNLLFLQDAAQAQPGGGISQWLFIILIIVVFYFFMIRPQQQQQKKLREQRNSMKEDDSVVTSGGLLGRIDKVIKKPNAKGVEEVDSFIIRLKPENTTRIQVAKDCVFKDLTDVQQQTK